jgi:5'-phosphate synthase pdxT subunit
VLALQGDFREHAVSLRALDVDTREVRHAHQLDGLDGLIIPGGESTTIARLLLAYDLHEPIRRLGQHGFPLWGTCAGAILLADDPQGLDRPALNLLPMTVDRNAFGRQIDSFEADIDAPQLGPTPYHAIFIRAPRIRRVADDVDVVMALDGEPVAVRRDALMATTFHPELTDDLRLHRFFLEHCVRPSAAARHDAAPAPITATDIAATDDVGVA